MGVFCEWEFVDEMIYALLTKDIFEVQIGLLKICR